MQFVERTLACLLAAGMVGCLQRSQIEPIEPDAGRPPLPTPPPGVLLPPPSVPPSPAAPPGGEGMGTPPAMPPPGGEPPAPAPVPPTAGSTHTETSFFVTSRGSTRGGGDFRQQTGDTDGLVGADALCEELATQALPALASKTWRAYLSTDEVDARDRIGAGPWRNSRGIVIAESLAQLHEEDRLTNNLVIAEYLNALDEKGNPVNLERHDILTGSAADGTVDPQGRTCNNWRSQSTQAQALVGHGDRKSAAGGTGGASRSWNAAHAVGCGPVPQSGQGNRVEGTVSSNGGGGLIYCFAAD
jgi:hypothetical protein